MKKLLLITTILFFGCATITVNVYFPDKDVEAVYEDIEDDFEFDVEEESYAPESKSFAEPVQSGKTELTLLASRINFGATPAWAEGKKLTVRDRIRAEIKKMKDVAGAIKRKKVRKENIEKLFDNHVVGLGSGGHLVALSEKLHTKRAAALLTELFPKPDKKKKEKEKLTLEKFLKNENSDRDIVNNGMALATLKATDQEITKDSQSHAVQRSVKSYVKSQKKKLKVGWYYQAENKWVMVEAPKKKPEKTDK